MTGTLCFNKEQLQQKHMFEARLQISIMFHFPLFPYRFRSRPLLLMLSTPHTNASPAAICPLQAPPKETHGTWLHTTSNVQSVGLFLASLRKLPPRVHVLWVCILLWFIPRLGPRALRCEVSATWAAVTVQTRFGPCADCIARF